MMALRFCAFVTLFFLSRIAMGVSGPVIPLRACLNNNDSIVTLEWQNPSNPCGTFSMHRIYGRKNANPFVPIAVVSSLAFSSVPVKLPDLDAGWEFYWVSLFACNGTDSFSSGILRVDDQKPVLTSLDSVSIDLATQRLVAGWQPGVSPDTKGYRLYRYNSGINDSLTETGQRFYLFNLNQISNPNIEVTLSTFDSCNLFSAISNPHRVMQLSGSIDTCKNEVSLNWSAYQGWSTTAHQLFLRKNQDVYRIEQTLSSSTLNALYTQFVLGDSFCFFVRASNGTVSSSSNEICFVTRKKITPTVNYIRQVTVISDKEILVNWSGEQLQDVALIQLERKSGGAFAMRGTYTSTNTFSLADNAVDPASTVYDYRVVLKDVCNIGLDTSNVSHNILLEIKDDVVSWNSYSGWDGTVDLYELYSGDGSTWNNSAFPTPTNYNLTAEEKANPKTCFYVIAKETGNTLYTNETSTSNIVCREGPFTYYVPNVIVSGGINNRFVVKGVNIDTSMSAYTIFNRWGEILHRSESIFEPWYPVYQGEDLMPGIYFYVLELFSNQGERKTVKGEIRIIK